jgi:hypothetical protein
MKEWKVKYNLSILPLAPQSDKDYWLFRVGFNRDDRFETIENFAAYRGKWQLLNDRNNEGILIPVTKNYKFYTKYF